MVFGMVTRRPRFVAPRFGMILLGCTALLLAACGDTAPPQQAANASRGAVAAGYVEKSSNAPPFVYSDNDIFASDRSYNLFNPAFPSQAEPLVVLPLAIQSAQSIDSYIPEVATSWHFHGREFFVDIRKHMVWQDKRPVTTSDVVASELLGGLSANPVWQDISSIKASGPDQVVFTLAPNVAPVVAEALILGTYVVPEHQYRRFLSPSLASTVETYYNEDRANPNTAPKTSAGKAVSSGFSSLEKFNPPSIIGDGPFIWKSWTTSEAYLVKSPTFFDAAKVHVPVFEFSEVNSDETAGAVLSGKATIDTAGLAYSVYEKELRMPHQHIYAPPGYEQFELLFNDREPPFNQKKVRQAIVYIIHRPVVLKLVYGPHPYYHAVVHPSLLYNADELRYVSKSQLDSLNSYPYSPSKATHLLESAGFHKRSGQWYMPNGKRFTVTMDAPSGFANLISTYKVFSSWLSSFGIKTTEVVLSEATYSSYLLHGNFQIAWQYGGEQINPLEFINTSLGPTENFPSGGAYNGEPGIGFGPVMNVPGIGKVNISHTINSEATHVNYGPQMKKLVWDWAKFVNDELPVFSYIDKNYPLQFSTSQYVHWPPKSSPLWVITAINQHNGLVAMIEDGYIRPRH